MKVTIGDIFDSKFDGGCRIITVNCIGAMGKGVAQGFRSRYNKEYLEYKQSCKNGGVHIGVSEYLKTPDGKEWIFLPTKYNWMNPSRLHWIFDGLTYIATNIGEPNYVDHKTTLVFPPPGAGNGNLPITESLDLLKWFSSYIPNEVIAVVSEQQYNEYKDHIERQTLYYQGLKDIR